MSRIVVFVIVGVLLLGAAVWAIRIWNSVDTQMSGHGYLAMSLGIIFTVALGVGLMGLVFYSSRKGHDL
jgi:uncharacterized membrane protein YiaA